MVGVFGLGLGDGFLGQWDLRGLFFNRNHRFQDLAGDLFLHDDVDCYWHLSAVDLHYARLRPVNAYLHDTILRAKRQGMSRMTLGGGYQPGDGVYGLRRALVLAGAESQLMSLWPVSDKGTRDLMIAYYTLLQQGVGRGAALRQVQLQLLKQPQRAHPYYWASFIQSGAWTKLDEVR